MTAVIVAFQRATSDPLEMPTTPGRPRDVQVAPQPLMAPGSPVTPRTGKCDRFSAVRINIDVLFAPKVVNINES